MANAIAACDLYRHYSAGEAVVRALRGVNMEIPEGDFAVVLGPSGSGKSTLLNIMGGMDRPTSGRVYYRGNDLTAFGEKALTLYRRREVGFVFQTYNLLSSLTARENVEISSELAEKPLNSKYILARVGLEGKEDRFPSQLSSGEQQRVAIARAVAKRPGLLLCDEPTGALDYETGKGILALLREMNREFGTTVVVVTHNAAIARMADRVFRMRSGQIVEEIYNPNPVSAEEIEW